jgi:hypothetical protein
MLATERPGRGPQQQMVNFGYRFTIDRRFSPDCTTLTSRRRDPFQLDPFRHSQYVIVLAFENNTVLRQAYPGSILSTLLLHFISYKHRY